jgi:PAS domain S-box-containing protein
VADHTIGWEFWIDKDENFLYCSPSCERITGYKASDFLNNPHLLYDIIHPDDLKTFLTHRKTKELNQVKDSELEYRIIRSDGTIRWIGHVCQSITDEMGVNKGIRGSNKDITRRKEMEQLLKTSNQKYRLLSANITDGIFICKQGRLEYVNKAMKRIFGFNKYKMEGLLLNHLALPEYQQELNDILNIHASSNQLRNIEIECYKKDRTIIYVEMLFTYVAKEKVIYGVVHDITDRKQTQKNTVKAIILTEEKERAYFSKELHDGLGPLLSAIKLYLQWSERPKSEDARVEIIHKAEDILEEALTTVKEISNKLSPHLLNYYGLTAAIQSFVDKVDETAALKISFESNVTIRLGNEIEAAFYRATIECINNSLKYAKAQNINIILDYTDDLLQLQYTDDGIGFNLEETLAVKKGLGSYNLQNRIQTIGGKINMYSSPGNGVNYQIVVKL